MLTLEQAQQNLDDLNEQLSQYNDRLENVTDQIDNYEIDPDDDQVLSLYNQSLNESYPLPDWFPVSAESWQIIEKFDNTLYRCGLSDWLDGLDPSDFNFSDYQELIEDQEEIQDQIDELEEKITDLEDEIEQLEMEQDDQL